MSAAEVIQAWHTSVGVINVGLDVRGIARGYAHTSLLTQNFGNSSRADRAAPLAPDATARAGTTPPHGPPMANPGAPAPVATAPVARAPPPARTAPPQLEPPRHRDAEMGTRRRALRALSMPTGGCLHRAGVNPCGHTDGTDHVSDHSRRGSGIGRAQRSGARGASRPPASAPAGPGDDKKPQRPREAQRRHWQPLRHPLWPWPSQERRRRATERRTPPPRASHHLGHALEADPDSA